MPNNDDDDDDDDVLITLQTVQVLAQKCLSTVDSTTLSPYRSLHLVLQCLASGMLLPGMHRVDYFAFLHLRQLLRTTARSDKRVLAIVILSVRPSVTARYQTKARCDRDSGFSPYDSVESLISCHWVRRFPVNRVVK